MYTLEELEVIEEVLSNSIEVEVEKESKGLEYNYYLLEDTKDIYTKILTLIEDYR